MRTGGKEWHMFLYGGGGGGGSDGEYVYVMFTSI